ncbi:hypothetical protein MRB53_011291 [Persea americana]|uniref:Uncharacterized protein n=1 Tax=Persea americana TaxID=3435 RepID=A0ACC2LUK6_PERAE|nr:hypothetical protein MRB53_011291 [Persea americana]
MAHAMASSIVTYSKIELITTSHSIDALRRRRPNSSNLLNTLFISPRRLSPSLLLSRATSSSSSDGSVQHNLESFKSSAVGTGDGYLGLFVRMLGMDHDPLDREQAIVTLWKYSEGGKHSVDMIMAFRGCVNLTVNLLKSDSSITCEAAAGLLRAISSVNLYKDSVAESGAIEEIIFLLNRSSLTAEVREQCLSTLWNLSVDKKLRVKIANIDLIPALIKFLDDEEEKVKEAAGGVLANLALSNSCHNIMVEAGVIPKLARLLKSREGSKVTRKEAKNVLLELAKDEYYRILILEEGLVMVPIVGAAAYKSFRPVSYSWPTLPDGTKIEQSASRPSRYGASELLLGLNIRDTNFNLEEAKANAIVGRTQQQFLARIGAIEMEDLNKPQLESSSNQPHTLLPWMDGIARLVLILGLEDETAVARAAQAIADASINEHNRISFKEAGAVKHLVQLLGHNNEAVRVAVANAVERLSVSDKVCHVIEEAGVLHPLVDILKNTNTSQNLMEKAVSILARIFYPGKEIKTEVNGSEKTLNGTTGSFEGITDLIVTTDDTSVSKPVAREKVLDADSIACLVNILKMPCPNLQKMAASILDYLATIETYVMMITAAGIESGLHAVFHQNVLHGLEDDVDNQPEVNLVETEEAGLAISAASRLFTKLLSFDHFCGSINSNNFRLILRKVLKSDIPLHSKDWVAACLVKLQSSSHSRADLDSPINVEVTLYETIPRLIEQIGTSFSPEVQEAAVVQLNNIISKGVVDFTRAVAAQGGIFSLVKLIESRSGSSLEACLAILYNLSMDSENHSAIISAGAVPILKRIVLSERPQWRRALHLLQTLPS